MCSAKHKRGSEQFFDLTFTQLQYSFAPYCMRDMVTPITLLLMVNLLKKVTCTVRIHGVLRFCLWCTKKKALRQQTDASFTAVMQLLITRSHLMNCTKFFSKYFTAFQKLSRAGNQDKKKKKNTCRIVFT